MSYKPIPYTYGAKTLAEINALTGMQEGDTVYNTTWQLIEIYSGTNWINNQSFEGQSRGVTVIPPSGTIPSGNRAGQAFPTDGGYAIAQHSNGTVELFDNTSLESDYLGCKIRGTSTSGSNERIVIAFSGKWPMFMEVAPRKGDFIEPYETYTSTQAGAYVASSSIQERCVGQSLEQNASSSLDTFRNFTCAVQTIEIN